MDPTKDRKSPISSQTRISERENDTYADWRMTTMSNNWKQLTRKKETFNGILLLVLINKLYLVLSNDCSDS